jgi:hypothetical protein
MFHLPVVDLGSFKLGIEIKIALINKKWNPHTEPFPFDTKPILFLCGAVKLNFSMICHPRFLMSGS